MCDAHLREVPLPDSHKSAVVTPAVKKSNAEPEGALEPSAIFKCNLRVEGHRTNCRRLAGAAATLKTP